MGIVYYFVTGLTLALFASRLVSIVASAPKFPKLDGAFFLIADILMGVWAIWLYSVLPHRPAARRALVTALAWWAMKMLQSAHWVALGFVPLDVVPIPLVTTLVSAILATAAGAALYSRVASV